MTCALSRMQCVNGGPMWQAYNAGCLTCSARGTLAVVVAVVVQAVIKNVIRGQVHLIDQVLEECQLLARRQGSAIIAGVVRMRLAVVCGPVAVTVTAAVAERRITAAAAGARGGGRVGCR